MTTEPEDGTKVVAYGSWVMVYRRGVGWVALHSAPRIGINEAAQSYWLRQADVGRSKNAHFVEVETDEPE